MLDAATAATGMSVRARQERSWLRVTAAMGVLALVITLVDNAGNGPDGMVLPLLLLPAASLMFHAFVARVPWVLLVPWVVAGPAVLFFFGYAEGSMFYPSLMALLLTHGYPNRKVAHGLCAGLSAIPIVAGLTTAGDTGWGFWFFGILLGWLFGHIGRENAELLAQLEDERAQRQQQAVVEERRRIARDIHDLVGHSLTVVLLHVTGARRALRRDPERAEAALASAEDVGRESLAEIRRSVSLLRTDETIDTRPSPSASDIEGLVEERRAAGQIISLRAVGDLTGIGGSVGVTAFRLVQESLSNAAKHAPASAVDIDVTSSPVDLRLAVENDLSPSAVSTGSSGYGLIGMRERVQAVEGNLVVGPAGARWRVDATLPRVHESEHVSDGPNRGAIT